MITLNNINLSSIDLSGIDLRGIKLGLGGRGGGSSDGFPVLPGDVTRWHFGGLTNEMMAAMDDPRIEDADHKGRFLSFKNFAWGGMSGCGGYSLSKETFSYTPDIYSFNFTDPEGGLKIFDVYFQLIGLEENSGVTFNLDIIESGTAKRIKRETYTKDGIYHFEYKSEDDAVRLYMIGYNGVGADRTTFTVKILPYYAGALVFDGVDDYGICENFPILTKEKGYTVVALRKWLTPENKTDDEVLVANLKKPKLEAEAWGAFGCEIKYNNTNPKIARTLSFGSMPVINVNENNVLLCQTSNNYNGVDITSGNDTGGPYLLICSGGRILFANAAIWELIILDHDATEEELTKIKDYFVKTYPWLFPDQAWTVVGKTNEDKDRATIANITGNGNDLILSNFGFIEGSGYNEEGEYAGYLVTDGVDDKAVSKQFKFGKNFTVILDFKFPVKKISYCGFDLSSKVRIQNLQGSGVYVVLKGNKTLIPSNVVRAVTSEGKVYDENWNEYNIVPGNISSNYTMVNLGFDGSNQFAESATKLAGIYSSTLSKDDCIKAYNYLQTLKAK